MPGIIAFQRRWYFGSDDLVFPGVLLFILHAIWLIIIGVIYGELVSNQNADECMALSGWWDLHVQLVGYFVILSVCCILETIIACIAMRGTILEYSPRASMQYLLYIRLGVLAVEVVWLIQGIMWLIKNYMSCSSYAGKYTLISIVVCDSAVILIIVLAIGFTFDPIGRRWYKNEMDVPQAYNKLWDHRCKIFSCFVRKSKGTNSNTLANIAHLLSDFFQDLDFVPSDIVVGLVLLRKYQKSKQKYIVESDNNDTFEFLSGVPITPRSQFLELSSPGVNAEFHRIVYYMQFTLAVYGWPIHVISQSTINTCKCFLHLRCCKKLKKDAIPQIIDDNCCACNTVALQSMAPSDGVDIIYINYHNDVNEAAFSVALDHSKQAIVISVRGTLSIHDVFTTLNADSIPIPLENIKEDWLGHKGMVLAAEYIRNKLKDEGILDKAFSSDPPRGTPHYDLVVVGHSLGGGTAAILAILLKQEHPSLICFAYSPPGGLLSMPVVEYSRAFITSVVVGKDVVPRLGVSQMETLTADMMNVIKKSKEPKWKIISSFGRYFSTWEGSIEEAVMNECSNPTAHPSDPSIVLTVHDPMFPPGRILHLVRHYPTKRESWIKCRKPVYQGLWVDNLDLGEVLIAPTCMIQDHMAQNVLNALENVLIHCTDLPLPV